MSYCSNCGALVAEGGSFCAKCGTPIGQTNFQQTAQPQPSLIHPGQQRQKQSPWLWVALGCGLFPILILGAAIVIIIAVPSLLESKRAAQATAAQATLRNIASAEVAYSSKASNRSYGTLADLASQGFLDSRFNSGTAAFDGYTFAGTATTVFFTVTGSAEDTANPNFYINHSMVVHYENGVPID